MTTIEALATWLAAAALIVVVVAAIGALTAEITFRRSDGRRRRLQRFRDHLDRLDETVDRASLLRDAKLAFGDVLTRDLDRDAQLAELFTDVCRRLTPALPSGANAEG